MRESIIFYKSFVEALKELPDDDRLKLYDAIFEFGIYGNEPELSGIDAAVFKLVRPQIEANNRKYENGIKGGRPKPNNNQSKTKAKPNHNQTITNTEPNVNANVNGNSNGNGNASGFANSDDIPLSLLSYLNSKTGGTYTDTEQTRELIEERLSEGYTEEDLRTVIDKKAIEWSCSGNMRANLRPSVLFGEKFEEYLNAPIPMEVERVRERSDKTEQLRDELESKRNELEQVQTQIDVIHNGGKSEVKKRFDELTELNLHKGILEQAIEQIANRLEVT
jgi:uncharacterized phage protein (TIGR02220 family)